jgi:hypothetical protein
VLPRSLRCVADAPNYGAEEKVGHSGRDDRGGAEMSELKLRPPKDKGGEQTLPRSEKGKSRSWRLKSPVRGLGRRKGLGEELFWGRFAPGPFGGTQGRPFDSQGEPFDSQGERKLRLQKK